MTVKSFKHLLKLLKLILLQEIPTDAFPRLCNCLSFFTPREVTSLQYKNTAVGLK